MLCKSRIKQKKRLIITNPTSSRGTVRATAELRVKTKPKTKDVKLMSLSKLMELS